MGWKLILTFLSTAVFSLLGYRFPLKYSLRLLELLGGDSVNEDKPVKETPGEPLMSYWESLLKLYFLQFIPKVSGLIFLFALQAKFSRYCI